MQIGAPRLTCLVLRPIFPLLMSLPPCRIRWHHAPPHAFPTAPGRPQYILAADYGLHAFCSAPPHRLVAHCVAAGGRWSVKGVMGSISRTLGDAAETQYRASGDRLGIGDIQLVPLPRGAGANPHAYVCNMLVQEACLVGTVPRFRCRVRDQDV